MNKSQKRLLIILGLLMLVGLILLGVILGWFYFRGRGFNSRPLVLIHSPYRNDHIQVGEGIAVHATAREDHGLQRIELWVNGDLVDELEAEEPNPINMVLFSTWTPTYVGHHQIIIQAISSDGIQGQSSVSIFATKAGHDEVDYILSQEDEALQGTAEEGAISADELTESGSATEPGDESPALGDEPASDEAPPPSEEDREEPFPEGEAPFMGFMFETFHLFTPPAGEVPLRIEIPRLQTETSYDGLHCYVSLAGSLPQWYPDLDRDQATDESFDALDDGWWNTESTLVGNNAPAILWPGDQALPLTVTCVGVIGGTEANNFRRTDLEVPPENWNGVQHEYETDSESGSLYFTVSITQLESIPREVPKWPDGTMTAPDNVRLNESSRTIEWDYEPEPDEEEIDGFRIYLNENLQWTEPADARGSRLPIEWFNPPCASTYTFGVTAFRLGFPDGPESYPGTYDLTQPREGCTREIQVIFIELETFDLGNDGESGDIYGDRGPAYGAFFANDQRVEFNGEAVSGSPEGLQHNTTYSIPHMAAAPSWGFTPPNYVITDVPTGGTLRVGFSIMDKDRGRCRDSDDPGCDDVLCSGTAMPFRDDAYGALDAIHRETITADNGRCKVTFEYRPAYGSPVGSRGEGGEPLPWLDMTHYHVNTTTGEVAIAVINGGTADWPERDLVIELQNRDGSSLGHFVFEDFALRPGVTETLRHPLMVLNPPYDACVVIDPFDDVLELFERTGAMFHLPICPRLPDLTITHIYYESTYGHRIRVVVQNIGDGVIDNRTVEFDIQLPDGSTLLESPDFPPLSLGPGEIHLYEFPELSDSIRAQMAEGYSVTINPDALISEQDYGNNSYNISEALRLWIYWQNIDVPYDVRDRAEFELDAFVVSGRDREQVANLNIRQDINWGSCFYPYHCIKSFDDYEYESGWFDIYGDQTLEITIDVIHPGTLWRSYTMTDVFRAPNWGSDLTHNGLCNYSSERDGDHQYTFDYHEGYAWRTRINICRDD